MSCQHIAEILLLKVGVKHQTINVFDMFHVLYTIHVRQLYMLHVWHIITFNKWDGSLLKLFLFTAKYIFPTISISEYKSKIVINKSCRVLHLCPAILTLMVIDLKVIFRTAIKVLFLCLKLCPSVMLDNRSCSLYSYNFLLNY